ncbi:hypothetical protein Esti_006358 [Eimeria stiedai]
MREVGNRFLWMKSPTPVPAADLAQINSLSAFARRLNLAGFKGRRTEGDLYEIFSKLKDCFRSFAPPPGLALDFTPNDSMSTDEAISQLFTFIPPARFIHDPTQSGAQGLAPASYAEFAADDSAEGDLLGGQGAEDEATTQPLRLVKFSSDPKHILANIIRSVYLHFSSPTCQQAAKRLDGVRRIFLRNNSKAAAFEPLLIYSLVQGNAASASKFSIPTSTEIVREGSEALMQHMATFKAPSNISPSPGIYDPLLLVTYFELVKAGRSKLIRDFEELLQNPVNEIAVGHSLFGDALASPAIHANITAVGNAIGTDKKLLQNVVKRIGYMAIDSSDATSILLPTSPNITAFVRGVSFLAFEGVFKQNGPYVMPGLPCGGNLSGFMRETGTGKKLGTIYYVYKYTRPLTTSHLPENVWEPDPESEIALYYKQHLSEHSAYLFAHVPRVCVRVNLFKRCSAEQVEEVNGAKSDLCHFVHTHQSFFFKVDGKGVFAVRKSMQKSAPRGGIILRARSAFGRTFRLLRRFFLSKSFLAAMVGISVRFLCVGAGLAGVWGGALCAICSIVSSSLFRTLYGVAPFKAAPSVPLSLASFLSADFSRNLLVATKLLGVSDAHLQSRQEREESESTLKPSQV